MQRFWIATPKIWLLERAVLQQYPKMVAISAYNTTVYRRCKILLQLVDDIAMVKNSCISIDFCCNCVVV